MLHCFLNTSLVQIEACLHTKFGGAQSRNRDFRGQKLANVVNFKPVCRYLGNDQY